MKILTVLLITLAIPSSAAAFTLDFLPPIKRMPVEIYRQGHSCVWEKKMPNRIFFYARTNGKPTKTVIGGRNALMRIKHFEWRVSDRFTDKQVNRFLLAKRPIRMIVTAGKRGFHTSRIVVFKPKICN